jgi:hypothetical protein
VKHLAISIYPSLVRTFITIHDNLFWCTATFPSQLTCHSSPKCKMKIPAVIRGTSACIGHIWTTSNTLVELHDSLQEAKFLLKS